VTDVTPTRSVVVELKDERRAMHEGYVFLDEKCLLLAGEILRELGEWAALQREFEAACAAATRALQAAVARHGLHELQVYPPADLSGARVVRETRSLMGVRLQQARLEADPVAPAPPPHRSPEVQACRAAFAGLVGRAAKLAAVAGNLERLAQEYRRSARRARALQDVLLPELDRSVYDIESRLEELDQEDAVWMRRGAG
jgi:V/A-type H+-transporting ATPase subunit D